MHDPRIQHHVTDAGPPNNSGVLNVVATLEHTPMMLKAKLICEHAIERAMYVTIQSIPLICS